MRSLPIQYGTIQIAAVAGEMRHASVSGFAKVRVLWLFRNFSILDFSVLNKKQQQLIAQVWHAGRSADAADAPGLIGTIDGFSPQLFQYQPPVPTTRSTPHSASFGLPRGLRTPAIWAALGVSLLAFAIGLPKNRLMPQLMPPSHIVVAAAATDNVSSTVALPAQTSAESLPPVADPPAVVAAAASGVRAFHPPDAMAQDASSLKATQPHPRAAASTKKPEVIIRVSVDREGRPQAFDVLQGDQKKVSAALAAAKRWSFQPCSADCEHLLKFTDYGGASIVQMIN